MKNQTFKALILGALLLGSSQTVLQAQRYSIEWFKIAGGGGTSSGVGIGSNSVFTVSGTVGQQDAGGPLTGGNFSLTGGFWALYAIQTPGAPVLTVTRTATNSVMVSWPSPSTGFVLQQAPTLAPVNWVAAPAPADNGTIRYIIVNPPMGNHYYRLKR